MTKKSFKLDTNHSHVMNVVKNENDSIPSEHFHYRIHSILFNITFTNI